MNEAERDQNHVTSLLAVSNVDGISTVKLYADPTTHRLLVDLPSSGGTVTSVSATVPTGLTVSGVPITTSGTIAIGLDTGYVIPLSSTLATYVVGPATATDNAIARFDGTTGKIIQDYTSGAPTVSDTGAINIPLATGNSFVVDTSTLVVDATNNRVGINNASPAVALDVVGQVQQYFNGVMITDTPSITGTMFGLSVRGQGLEIAGIQASTTGEVRIGAFRASYMPMFYAGNTAEVGLTNTALYPATNDGNGLGTATLSWSDLFLAEGGVINWDNGDATLTQVGNAVTLAGADLLVTTSGTAATSVATLDATQTLNSKRINPRITSIASSATPTPDVSTTDEYVITALAAGATFGAPTGTPLNGQKLIIRVKDNATPRTLAYNPIYRAIGVTLPATTVASKTLYLGTIYNSDDTTWDVVAVAQEA